MTSLRPNINRRSRVARGKKSRHLLEVKIRTDTVRRQRTRKIYGVLVKMMFLLVLLISSYFGGRLLIDKFFFKNPDYNVKHLDVSLDGVMTVPEFKECTGFTEGINIFHLDLAAAEKKLRAIPFVKKAHVERVLPDTVQVLLEHRVPILRLTASLDDAFVPGQSFVIDQDGVVMNPEKLDATLLELPTVKGIDTSKIHLGEALEDDNALFVLELWKALNNSTSVTLNLRSIDVTHGYCAVVTDSNNTHFTFGTENLPSQIERLQKLLAHCQETGRQLATVNLMLEHNTPVTFLLNSEVVKK